jgi:hypothetical protein
LGVIEVPDRIEWLDLDHMSFVSDADRNWRTLMFLWANAGRLRPMRMVWSKQNHNYPKYSPDLREVPRMEWVSGPKVDDDRENRRRFPGRTGEWPAKSTQTQT